MPPTPKCTGRASAAAHARRSGRTHSEPSLDRLPNDSGSAAIEVFSIFLHSRTHDAAPAHPIARRTLDSQVHRRAIGTAARRSRWTHNLVSSDRLPNDSGSATIEVPIISLHGRTHDAATHAFDRKTQRTQPQPVRLQSAPDAKRPQPRAQVPGGRTDSRGWTGGRTTRAARRSKCQ